MDNMNDWLSETDRRVDDLALEELNAFRDWVATRIRLEDSAPSVNSDASNW